MKLHVTTLIALQLKAVRFFSCASVRRWHLCFFSTDLFHAIIARVSNRRPSKDRVWFISSTVQGSIHRAPTISGVLLCKPRLGLHCFYQGLMSAQLLSFAGKSFPWVPSLRPIHHMETWVEDFLSYSTSTIEHLPFGAVTGAEISIILVQSQNVLIYQSLSMLGILFCTGFNAICLLFNCFKDFMFYIICLCDLTWNHVIQGRL